MAQKKGNIEGADVNLPPNLSYTYIGRTDQRYDYQVSKDQPTSEALEMP
jgi:hypothetical protein